jgi:Sushi repeat (SCR repeat)
VILTVFFTVTYCPSLTIDHGWLSTKDVQYSVVVTAHCNHGFMFAEGIVTKALQCLEHSTWNDTFVNCIREFMSICSGWNFRPVIALRKTENTQIKIVACHLY